MTRRSVFLACPGEVLADQIGDVICNESIGRFVANDSSILVNPTAQEMRTGIVEFCQGLYPDDIAVVFLVGYSYIDPTGDRYLVGSGSNPAMPESTMMSIADLDKAIQRSPCQQLLVVIDQVVVDARPKPVTGDVGHWLTSQNPSRPGSGLTVFESSTQSDSFSSAPRWTSRGRLTGAVLHSLRSGAADLNDDGLVTTGELLTMVDRDLSNEVTRPVRFGAGRYSDDTVLARTAQGPEVDRPGRRPATVGQRVAARIIDVVFWVFCAALLGLIADPAPRSVFLGKSPELLLFGSGSEDPTLSQSILFTSLGLSAIAYEVVSLFLWGRTPGKKLLGLEITLPVGKIARLRSAVARTFPLGIACSLMIYEAWNPSPLVAMYLEASNGPLESDSPFVFGFGWLLALWIVNMPFLVAGRWTMWDRLAGTKVLAPRQTEY